ncbi:DUF2786 domain-containing protein [Lysinibacillus fusiformis]|uniref:DUF2786 domain-containing protein n=1 Tax=Lysinibacillus fusiformis TaxID=28031 RepID=UPI0035BEB6E0|nr:DUF2786 domain-containing protein [Lysinibacillus fusiformis]
MEEEKLDAIIRKIKGLLATAEDNANEDEAQTAFVLAQKMMMKYNIETSDIEDKEGVKIVKGQATAHKTLYWYEKRLASIVSDNFRVKFYYNNKYNNSKKVKRTIMFFGLDHDVKIAKEIYVLANDAMDHYLKCFIDEFYLINNFIREKSYTMQLKASYLSGFLDGLQQKLDSQRTTLQEEYGLILLTPKVVEDSYNELSKSFNGTLGYKMPKIEEMVAYAAGLEDGNKIDYSKSTIDDEIEVYI